MAGSLAAQGGMEPPALRVGLRAAALRGLTGLAEPCGGVRRMLLFHLHCSGPRIDYPSGLEVGAAVLGTAAGWGNWQLWGVQGNAFGAICLLLGSQRLASKELVRV